MKIVIITEIFWPEYNDFKNKALATKLASEGEEVIVLAPYPNYPTGKIFPSYKMQLYSIESISGFKIIRLPIYPDHSKSGIKRVLRYVSFAMSIFFIGSFKIPRVDVIFVDSPPMTIGVVGVILKFLKKSKLVLDVGDLWPEAINQSGMSKNKVIGVAAGLLANFSYKFADKITTLTGGFSDRISNRSRRKDISIIPPWADPQTFYPTEKSLSFIDAHNLSNKFIIMHAGNIGPFQNLDYILDVAKVIKNENVAFVFVGAGSSYNQLNEYKKLHTLDNVIFPGSYSSDKMSAILACADLLLVSLTDSDYLNINIPSKLPAYLAMGIPILAVCNGEVASFVNKYKLGVVSHGESNEILAQKIIKFKNTDICKKEEYSLNCLKLYDEYFSMERNINKYAEIIRKVGSEK